MTLGGFALAVGILVDNGTVVIENIERHTGLHAHLRDAIVEGAGEVGTPTFLSTLCICIVFVPVFLLEGTAKYLFSPLSVSVIVALLASLALSFTLVPVLFNYLMRDAKHGPGEQGHGSSSGANPFRRIHLGLRARVSVAFARPIATRWPGRSRIQNATAGAFALHHAGIAAALPAARARLLSASGCGADAPARARPHRARDLRPPSRTSRASSRPFEASWEAADQRRAGQYRAAL